MSMLHRNWLEPGYYTEDEYGDLTKVDVNDRFTTPTHYHDGYTFGSVNKEELDKFKEDQSKDDDVSMFSHWKD